MAEKSSKKSSNSNLVRQKNKLPFLIAGLAVILIVIAAVVTGDEKAKPKTQHNSAPVTACGPYRTDVVVRIKGEAFDTEIAKNAQEFAKGLGGRPCILPNQAMLFPFTKEGHYAFWMKDMKFPIDVIWINAAHKVAAIEIDFQPSTYPERRGNQQPAQYVLEVKANRTKELNIDLGTPVAF
jgi:uncharacterized membrane protein (UPF0127 family)